MTAKRELSVSHIINHQFGIVVFVLGKIIPSFDRFQLDLVSKKEGGRAIFVFGAGIV